MAIAPSGVGNVDCTKWDFGVEEECILFPNSLSKFNSGLESMLKSYNILPINE